VKQHRFALFKTHSESQILPIPKELFLTAYPNSLWKLRAYRVLS
jgi:hypothetical protein